MKASTKATIASVIFVMLTPMRLFAHPMLGVGDFYSGMLHPVITIESILPLIAFSLLAGQQRREAAIPSLAAFPMALIVGALLSTFCNIPSFLGTALVIQTLCLGLLVATARPVGVWIFVMVSAILGISVGSANGQDALGQVSTFPFVGGLALTGLLLLVYGNGLVRNLKAEWTRIAIRVVGSWVAAICILVLGVK